MMLWSSLLFLIHINGIHITTKRNWLYECISLCLLIMCSDIVKPCLLTFEPSENTNDMLRGMQREFTVMNFFIIINKLHRI